MEVTFWGTRGSISTPGRITEKYGGNTPCVSVRSGDDLIVLDAGTGLRNLGLELERDCGARLRTMTVHLFVSHSHWDHIQGIPFFAPAYMNGVRIVIYGSSSKRGFLHQIIRGQMDPGYFPVQLSMLSAELTIRELDDRCLNIGPFTVDWEEQIHHPGGSVRYRIREGARTVVYSSDVELDKFFVADPSPQQKRQQDAYMAFVEEADLLIGDGQYTSDEYPLMKGYGHTSMTLLMDVAYRAKVSKLAVFHHEPRHTDAVIDALWREYHTRFMSMRPPMNVFWAREGLTIPI